MVRRTSVMKKIGIIGAGSWGTALATVVADKGNPVKIWDIDAGHLQRMEENRENVDYLPGVPLGENIAIATSQEDALRDADVVLFSAPAQHFRSALEGALPYIKDDALIINVAKGIEQKSLKRMSEIAADVLDMDRYVVLSGPSHAEEVGRKLPTTVATASRDLKAAEAIQDLFMTERFRVYTTDDVVGVELGGALKNIIAIAAGFCDGSGLGDNSKAALITRGLAEMARLGVCMGAKEYTFAGLTGIGDLVVTCTSRHSRNNRFGHKVGKGMPIDEALKEVGTVEGYYAADMAHALAQKYKIEMPIIEECYAVLYGGKDVRNVTNDLMRRPNRSEH